MAIDNMKTLITMGGIYHNGGADASDAPHEITTDFLGRL